MANPSTKPPGSSAEASVVAHRGASADRPENTFAAFDEALAQGADAIEFDVQLSADAVPVVFHDRTLAKVGVRQRPRALTLRQLRRLDFGAWFGHEFAGERIPTLGDVLARYGGRCELMVELKMDGESPRSKRWRDLIDASIATLTDAGVVDRSYVLSFDATALQRVARRAPELRCVLNWDKRAPDEIDLGAAVAFDLPARFATQGLGDRLRADGRALWVYRCDTESTLGKAVASGAEALITDRPGWLRAAL